MRTLRELIDRNARYFPRRLAYVYGDRRVTHGEHAARALRLSSGLHRLGLRRQDRFAVLGMNCLEYYECYAAAEASGFLIAPVNFRLAPPEIEYVLRDAGARLLVFEAQYAEVVGKLRPQLKQIENYVCIAIDAQGRRTSFETPSWAVDFEQLVRDGDEGGAPHLPRPEDYAYLWYTSGTTGKPKGVAWRQASLATSARMSAHVSEFTGASRYLQTSPAFHIGGKGYVLGASWDGGATVIHRGFDAVAALEAIQRERVTHTFMVAAMVQAVLAAPNVGSYDLSSLEQVFSASAPIPVPVLRRAIELLGPVFSIQYGCTEIGNICGLPRHEVNPSGSEQDLRRLGSVGHPVAEIAMRLVDDDGRDAPVGKPGEVIVKSPCMLDGYWNNASASLEAIRDGWYHTGDIGVQDEEGYVYLIDRKKDMIISGGENIYSREVEEALASHADVADCAVIGVPDPKWVESVKALVVLRAGAALEAAALIAHCKTRIASYKCPKSIDFVAELPRLPTGKVDKPTLRSRYRN
jgi:acyl-CoA synthetase (AMP-forming)/AMP-acid ligase II